MTTSRASVLVHGASGFTGKLVCEALARRGVVFGVSGRSRAKLERVAAEVGAVEVSVVDVSDGEALEAVLAGRALVCACAGPFVDLGEPVLATCARLGVAYVDTTGEQAFVKDAVARYAATAEASGACVVPAMGLEIAIGDWAAHLASERVGGSPDTIEILYATLGLADGAGATSRGTKLSALGVAASRQAVQFCDGALVPERAAEKVATFTLSTGKRVMGISIPSPDAVVVPRHTGARTVRTFLAMGAGAARALHMARAVVPSLVRLGAPLATATIRRTADGPEGAARHATFEVVARATRGGRRVQVSMTGRDPYGLTAEIQAYAASRALAGAMTARGVVAPSVAFPPVEALEALARFVRVIEASPESV